MHTMNIHSHRQQIFRMIHDKISRINYIRIHQIYNEISYVNNIWVLKKKQIKMKQFLEVHAFLINFRHLKMSSRLFTNSQSRLENEIICFFVSFGLGLSFSSLRLILFVSPFPQWTVLATNTSTSAIIFRNRLRLVTLKTIFLLHWLWPSRNAATIIEQIARATCFVNSKLSTSVVDSIRSMATLECRYWLL